MLLVHTHFIITTASLPFGGTGIAIESLEDCVVKEPCSDSSEDSFSDEEDGAIVLYIVSCFC